MRFQCSNCMGVVAIDDSEAGHAVGCGHCGSIIMVPQSRTANGAIIDDFVIEKEVGQGGLATVYQAHQISLDRPAALKILRDQYASNRSFISDFVKEARAAAQLNHPNIVQAYAVGEEDDVHFFAMEYVNGETLKHVLAHSGRLFPDKALEIIRVIAEALEFAWQKKELIHLDIKPDNIILTEGKEYKLADLGLARIGGDIRESTDTSEVFGTPQYIAPEILTGSPTDNRTDIYSLGATLYHAVTGKHPFQGQTASEIARKHITEKLTPAHQVSEDIPKDVSDLIDIMMAKRPGHRWQSAAEVVREIDHIRAGEKLSRRPEPYFQKPLNLEQLDEELSLTLDDVPRGTDKKTASGGGGKKISIRKSATRLKTKAGDSTPTLKTKKKADKTSSGANKTSLRSKRKRGTAEAVPLKTSSTEKPSPGGEAEDNQAPGREKAPAKAKKKKKKMSAGAMLGCLGAVFLVVIIGAAVGIFLIKQAVEEKAYQEKIGNMNLSVEQYEALMDFRRQKERGVDDTSLLAKARKLLEKHSNSDAMAAYVRSDVQDVLEREILNLRQDRRETEIKAWRERARELQEEKNRAEIEAAERARKAEELRKQQELAQRLQRQKEEQIQALKETIPDVRRQALLLCRNLDFAEAKILFVRFKSAPSEELVAWAESKEQTIQLASEAFDWVRNGEKYLAGERLSIKDSPQKVAITGIQTGGLSTEYREKTFVQGKFVGEKVQNFTVDFEDIKLDQLVKLMEISARRQEIPEADINLKIGAFMLTVGAPKQLVQARLASAGQPDLTGPMLQELDAMNE